MISDNSLLEEIKGGEGKKLEFKESLPKSDQIAKTVIAFSNTSGGKIVIGVNDDRVITGINSDEDVFSLQDTVSSIIYDNCAPVILPEIYVENIEGKELLVIEVFRGGHLPYYLKNKGKNQGTYLRLGATNRLADYEHIVELERHRRNVSFDEEINYDISLNDLDLSPLEKEFAKAGKTLDEDKYKNLKLIKEEKDTLYPTHGLLILLGQYEHVSLKCSRFKGTTMDLFLDRKEYTGDLFSQMEQAVAFIQNHLHLRSEISGLKRVDTYEIPMEAIRETLVNAIVHRDYTNRGRDIKIGIYDDIVNVVSPGSLPFGLTVNELLKGRSEVRNRTVARVFKELGYIEQWGSGIQRIYSSCEKAGLKEPVISESGDFVDIELFRDETGLNNDSGTSEKKTKTSEKTSEKKMKTSEKIYELLKENPERTIKDLADLLKISTRAVEMNLKKLQEQKLLRREGSDRAGVWVVC